MTDRRIDYLPIDEVPEADRNAKTHARDQIADSMRAFDFTSPLILDERTGRLVAGHGRLEALRAMRDNGEPPPGGVTADDGRWWVPVVRGWASGDDEHAQAVVIADNRLTEAGGWDDRMLAELLDEITDYNPDLLVTTGFTHDDLDQLLRDIQDDSGTEGGGEDEAPEPPAEPHSKRGDLWHLGDHRLLCGDATDPAAYDRLLDGAQANLVWTDPPYGVSYVGKTDDALTLEGDARDADQLHTLLTTAFPRITENAKPGAPVYVAHPAGALSVVFGQAFIQAGWRLHQTLVWVKDRMVLGHSDYHYRHEPILYGYLPGGRSRRGRGHSGWYGDHSQTSVFEINRPSTSTEHPTMKPVELVTRAIVNSSRKRDTVLDPFAGSGTTLIAAHLHGRRCYAMELSPAYCDVILRRFHDQTGQTPVHAGTGEPFPVDKVTPPEPEPAGV